MKENVNFLGIKIAQGLEKLELCEEQGKAFSKENEKKIKELQAMKVAITEK